MAQVYTFRWCDDLDGSNAVETIEFSLDRCRYSIDVNAGNAARLRAVLATYIAADRRTNPWSCYDAEDDTGAGGGSCDAAGVGAPPGQATPPAAPTTERPAVTAPVPAPVSAVASTRAVVDRWQVKAMRQWARRHGYEVPAKGRIPDRVIAAYHQQAGTRRINIHSA